MRIVGYPTYSNSQVGKFLRSSKTLNSGLVPLCGLCVLLVHVQQFIQLFTQLAERLRVVFDLDAPAKGVHTLALIRGGHARLLNRSIEIF